MAGASLPVDLPAIPTRDAVEKSVASRKARTAERLPGKEGDRYGQGHSLLLVGNPAPEFKAETKEPVYTG